MQKKLNKNFRVGQIVVCTWGTNKGKKFKIELVLESRGTYSCSLVEGGDGRYYEYDDNTLELFEDVENEVFNGRLTIGDELYLEQIRKNQNVERLSKFVFDKKINSNVEVTSLDVGEEDYPIACATIHFYKGKKELSFDMVEGILSYTHGLEVNNTELGCDTASFEVIGKNHAHISTLSDGYYGNAFEVSNGEIIISVYVTHDSMNSKELEHHIRYALGL